MGWRLGYIAYPNADLASDPELGFQMSKVQDTIPICVTQMSQVAGAGALQAGSPWVKQQVQGLSSNRSVKLFNSIPTFLALLLAVVFNSQLEHSCTHLPIDLSAGPGW